MRNLLILLLVLGVVAWLWGIQKAATLFSLTIERGKVVKSSGRIPPRLFTEIEEIIQRAGVTKGHIRAVTRDGRPVLQFKGEMSPDIAQQMRNVMGQFTAQEIKSGRKH